MDQRGKPSRVQYLEALCRTVPYHIVEVVLDQAVESAVANQTVTGSLLYADLVGFTSMCERLMDDGAGGLSRVTHVLNHLFSRLLERAVFPHRGYVIEFGGDSLSAVFSGEDHVRRAAGAALMAQHIMHGEVGRLLGGRSGELTLRVGIATGEIKLPIMGDLAQRSVLCAGETAHRALVLQRRSAPNAVVIDRPTLVALGDDAEVVTRSEEGAVLRALRRSPPLAPIAELAGRVELRTEEKISLLEPFVPQPLAARLKSRPGSWWSEGELRRMVILFADLWGLDRPETSSALAADVSRSLVRAFRKYGGVVLKANLTEDGHRLMVVFGLHHPSANDPERALLAALEVNARLRAFTVGGEPIFLRIGLHVGRVFLGAIGSALKHDLTVIGDTVNVAARVASQAEPFEILATENVVVAVRDSFQVSARLPIQLKGKRAPLKLYVVHAASEAHAHYLRQRRQRRFCAGRAAQRAQLGDAVGEGLAGASRVVGLCGAHGTGKSFLLAEVIDQWTAAGGVGLLGRCRYSSSATPLAPVVQAFASFLGLTVRDSEGERRERIRRGLRDLDLGGGAADLVALLQPVRRPDGTDEAMLDLAEPRARERILDAIVGFIEQQVKAERALYVLEDLHFADTLTLQLVQRLAATALPGGHLLVTTYRPVPTLRDLRHHLSLEVTLDDFTLQETVELLCHEVGAREADAELAAFLWQRTKGNPGYLTEVVRFLAARGLVVVRAGVAQSAHRDLQLLDDVVPPSLAHVALARLDELGAIERRVLRTASVIGRRFDRSLLNEASEAELADELLVSGMATLEGQGVIIKSPHLEHGYMFRDAITRAVAYGTIPEADRRQMHRRIADALEHLAPGDPRRVASVIAMHRERAEQLDEAVAWYERAVRLAVRGGLDREARDLAERWETVVARLPAAERPEPRVQARMLINKLVATARIGQPAEAVRLGRLILGSPGWAALEQDKRAVVDYWLGVSLALLGKTNPARERLKRAVAGAPQRWLRCDAARELARLEMHAADLVQARAWLDRANQEAGDDTYRHAQLALMEANLANEAGELDRAAALYREVADAAREHNHRQLFSAATTNLAACALRRGEFAAAKEGFTRAVAIDHALADWLGEAIALVNLGQTFVWAGEYNDAVPLLERALTLGEEVGDGLTCAEARVHLGAAMALSRDPRAGRELCQAGLEAARAAELHEAELAALLHLARIAVQLGEVSTARALLREASGSAEVERRPLFAQVYRALRQAVE